MKGGPLLQREIGAKLDLCYVDSETPLRTLSIHDPEASHKVERGAKKDVVRRTYKY